MKKSIISLSALSLLLVGCGNGSTEEATLEERLENPLYAERYYEALVDRMTEFEIRKDPILEDAGKKGLIDETRRSALEETKNARAAQREGMTGFFVEVSEYTFGEALYLDDILYLSTTFEVEPGPSVHLYLTTAVDPRDGEFPDESSVDLGEVRSFYGAQAYTVPSSEISDQYRTVVLWDTELGRIHGFAQLSK